MDSETEQSGVPVWEEAIKGLSRTLEGRSGRYFTYVYEMG